MRTNITEIYVLTLDGGVYLGPNIHPYHIDLASAKLEIRGVPDKKVRDRINIHKFRSCGIEEHGKAYDEITEKDKQA